MNSSFAALFQSWLNEYFDLQIDQKNFVQILFKSQSYSLQSGGKRFRPYLAYQIYQIWKSDFSRMKNFCLAIEMIHTYSLIHDDLPCMDNDDYRRGQLSNHKVFGEDIALLAGDSLLTEAFRLISIDTALTADVRIGLVQILSEKIGSLGMVAGQVLDMKAARGMTFSQLQQVHEMKTAFLIQAACEGAALAAGASETEIGHIREFSRHLGLAFQIKDDLLDRADSEQDFKSYVTMLGTEKTIEQLKQHSDAAHTALRKLAVGGPAMQTLEQLVSENEKRIS